jgi:hypothetical protein
MYFMPAHLNSNKQPSDLTDDVLLQQAQSGDQDAFEILVDRYSALLILLISLCQLLDIRAKNTYDKNDLLFFFTSFSGGEQPCHQVLAQSACGPG